MDTHLLKKVSVMFTLQIIIVVVTGFCICEFLSLDIVAKLTKMDDYFVKTRIGPTTDNNSEPDMDRLCTHALFREFYVKYRRMPSEGFWIRGEDDQLYFQPKICKFRYDVMENDGKVLPRCLLRSNVDHVVTVGDSNGGRHYVIMREMIGRKRCRAVDGEELADGGFLPDKNYFTRSNQNWTEFVQVHYRFCKTCASSRHLCHLTSANLTGDIRLQHVAMTMLMDNSVQLHVPEFRRASGLLEDIFAPTTQQFIFRYFLRDDYPDVIIIFLPFNHVKRMALEISKAEMKYFHALAKFYLPANTKIFYMPTPSEFEEARLALVWVNRTYSGMMATEMIDKLNQNLFDVLYDDLTADSGRVFAFLDLLKISRDRGDWSEDGIHMHWTWYKLVMSMFWETYCNSVRMDAF